MFNFEDGPYVLEFEHECCHGGHGHSDESSSESMSGKGCGNKGGHGPLGKPCRELWTGKEYATLADAIKEPVDAHGARLYKIFR